VEHAVIVTLAAPLAPGVELFELEDELIEAIDSAGVGEFDGNLIGGDEVVLYMYGPDADTLFAAIEPVLANLPPPRGSYAVKRYGPPDDATAKEVRIDLMS